MILLGEEAMELCKRSTMQASLYVCMLFYPCSRTNVSQVLNHNGTARRSILDNLLAQHMVMVSPLAQQCPTQLYEVSLSRVGAFCQKATTQARERAKACVSAAGTAVRGVSRGPSPVSIAHMATKIDPISAFRISESTGP